MKRFRMVLLLLMVLSGTVSWAKAQDVNTSPSCGSLKFESQAAYAAGEPQGSTKPVTNAMIVVKNDSLLGAVGCIKFVTFYSSYYLGRVYKGPGLSLAPQQVVSLDVPLPDCQYQLELFDGPDQVFASANTDRPSCGERGNAMPECNTPEVYVDEVRVNADFFYVTLHNDSNACTFEGGIASYGLNSILREGATEEIDPGGHHEFAVQRGKDGFVVAFEGVPVIVLQGKSTLDKILGLSTFPIPFSTAEINKACAFVPGVPVNCPYFSNTMK